MSVFRAQYDRNNLTGEHEWNVWTGDTRVCSAVNQWVAEQTAFALTELRDKSPVLPTISRLP